MWLAQYTTFYKQEKVKLVLTHIVYQVAKNSIIIQRVQPENIWHGGAKADLVICSTTYVFDICKVVYIDGHDRN